jgi:uroporphyrinogen III methyltransferase/synthase
MTAVLVTRPATQAGGVCAALEAAGLEAVCLPLTRIVPLADSRPLDSALANLGDYDWIVFTSANAVRGFVRRAGALRIDLAGLTGGKGRSRPQICAGPATAAAMAADGLVVGLLVSPFTAEQARDALLPHVGQGSRVLLPRAEAGRDLLGPALRERGAQVDEVVLYRTESDRRSAAEAVRRLAAGELGAAAFFSPSAVRALRAAAGSAGIGQIAGEGDGCDSSPTRGQALMDGVAVATIGPTTTRAVQEAGWRVAVEAPDTTGEALVDALTAYLFKVKG